MQHPSSRLPLSARRTPLSQALRTALASAMLALPACWSTTVLAQPAGQQQAATRSYQIPAGALGANLGRFAAEAGIVLSFDASLTAGKQSAGLQGNYDIRQGLATLLAGSQLEATELGNGNYGLRRIAQYGTDAAGVATLGAITVAGTAGDTDGLPPAYAGGQVASASRLGILGNTHIMDSPFTMTSYTAQHIANSQAGTVGQVLQSDPSVRFTTSAGHVYETYSIRGQSIGSGDLAFDGLYGLAPDGHIPTEFLERVEVLRGPSALLSGMPPGGAVGGMINIVPKRAGKTPVTDLTLDYTSDAQLGAHLDLGRRIGADQSVGIRFNGAYRDGDTGVDEQSKRRQLAALALDWRGERARVSLDAFYNEEYSKNGSPMMISMATVGEIVRAPDNKTNILQGVHATQRSDGVLLRGEYDLSDQWTAYAAAGSAHSNYKGFLNGTRGVLLNTAGDYRGVTYQQRGGRTVGSGEAGVRGRFATGPVQHELVLSATLLSINTRNRATTGPAYDSNLYNPATPILVETPEKPLKTGDTRLTSLALADTLSFADERVRLVLGARMQRVQSRSWNQSTGVLTGDYDERRLTPSVGLVVKPWSRNVSLYANFIEGLTQGGSVTDAGAENYGETFKPYTTRQVEAGIKWEHQSLTQTLALYQMNRTSLIKVTQADGSYVYSDDGRQRSRGIEWNIFGELARDWRLLGGVSYNRVQYTRNADSSLDGNTVYGMPNWSSNLGVEWDTPWIAGLSLSGRVVYTGKQYLNSTNTLRLGSWTRIDAGARYATKISGRDVVFRANVENLFDRSYWEGTFGDGFATLNAPRTFKLSATIGF